MKTVLNVIWLILCGLWMCLFYLFAGVLLCITIIGIPFGLASFRIGLFALWPFGRKAVERGDAGAPSLIGNILWLILAGWWLALGHVFTGLLLCITIIGIPLGLANFKMIPISLLPLGREIVPTDEPFTAAGPIGAPARAGAGPSPYGAPGGQPPSGSLPPGRD